MFKYAVLLFFGLMSVTMGRVVIDDGAYVEAEGKITWISRHCKFATRSALTDETIDEGAVECAGEPEFIELRDNLNSSTTRLVGDADVQVSYKSPVTGEERTDTFKVDAQKDEFYTLRENDRVRVDVNKEKPGFIRFIDKLKAG